MTAPDGRDAGRKRRVRRAAEALGEGAVPPERAQA